MDELVWPHVPYAAPTRPERERWIEQVAREDREYKDWRDLDE